MSLAYYNEHDAYAAQWLRNLIEAGHIAPGYVDERSIEDVRPNDLAGFTQCHFFAGVGVWSLALRRAGWPDSRPVWTGSCPCQPFSAAGRGNGFADERHLWPAFHYLIGQRAPVTVLGEQVASKDAMPWVDLVQTDMEALGYAFGAVPFPAASVGAPHIRDRLYWVGHSTGNRSEVRQFVHGELSGQGFTERCDLGGLAYHHSDGCHPGSERSETMGHGQTVGADCGVGGMGHTDSNGARRQRAGVHRPQTGEGWRGCGDDAGAPGADYLPGPTNGHWRDADWLGCRDDKWRPVEPGTFPLAHGAPARVGRLRAYGNAINAIQAEAFIRALTPPSP